VLTRRVAKFPKPVRVAAHGINLLLLVRYWVLAWNILVLYRAWRGRGIDVLHINNGGYPGALSCLAGAIAARLAGIACVVMVVNNITQKNRYWYWWFDGLLDRWIAHSVNMFVTGSIPAGRALQSALKLPDRKWTTLHNGIAPRQSSQTRSQTRLRLGVEGAARPVFGIVALLERRKGHHVLLRAMAALRDRVGLEKMPMLLIEGEGPEYASLVDLVDRLGLRGWVRFVGVERHVFDFMQALDVVLLPSIAHEDFPNVVLEAMSLGKPVIASRLAGMPEQIDDGVTGWLVAPGDPVALAQKMATFIDEPASVLAMGVAARERFIESFTADVAVSRYWAMYQALLRRIEK